MYKRKKKSSYTRIKMYKNVRMQKKSSYTRIKM